MSPTAPRKIILDVDPGHDDAIAILLACGSPSIELVGLTTVAGNQSLDKVTANALRVATLAGALRVPVAAGADRPLRRDPMTDGDIIAGSVHGESGLDGPELPRPRIALDQRSAAELIVGEVMSAAPGEITLVPTGPLTNLALALRLEPAIAGRVREVVSMGGSFTRGNVTPTAEFNVYVDPEAAADVYAAGWPVTMVGLDLTHQAVATPEVVERIRAVGGPVARVVVAWLEYFGATYRQVWRMPYPPIHDACAVARVADQATMRTRDAFIAVETSGEWTTGTTVTDFLGALGRPFNHRVATELDPERFWDLVVDAISRLGPGPSPAPR